MQRARDTASITQASCGRLLIGAGYPGIGDLLDGDWCGRSSRRSAQRCVRVCRGARAATCARHAGRAVLSRGCGTLVSGPQAPCDSLGPAAGASRVAGRTPDGVRCPRSAVVAAGPATLSIVAGHVDRRRRFGLPAKGSSRALAGGSGAVLRRAVICSRRGRVSPLRRACDSPGRSSSAHVRWSPGHGASQRRQGGGATRQLAIQMVGPVGLGRGFRTLTSDTQPADRWRAGRPGLYPRRPRPPDDARTRHRRGLAAQVIHGREVLRAATVALDRWLVQERHLTRLRP